MLFACTFLKIVAYKWFNVPVHNAKYVAGFVARSVVFHHGVWVENI